MLMKPAFPRIVAATLAAVISMGGSFAAGTQVEPRFNLFSPKDDVEIGKRSATEVERQLPLVGSGSVNSFVSDMGRALARHAPGADFPYRFKVVNASDLNAFALPGGFIYINRGTLQAARTEGEVAGVLAHEIAHLALRHGTHNVSKAYVTQAGVGLLDCVIGRKASRTAEIIQAAGGFGMNVLFLKHSRTAETEADLLGSQIMAAAGYDPRDMARFFETIDRTSRRDQRLTVNWLSSHPSPARRIERVRREASTLQVSSRRQATGASLARVKGALAALPPAPTTSQLTAHR